LRWLAYFKNETTILDGNINPAALWLAGYRINTGVTNPGYFGMKSGRWKQPSCRPHVAGDSPE
jgi:hypothetical protein